MYKGNVLKDVSILTDVINAKVDEGISSNDACLRTFAVRAARLSKFSISTEAPARQMGTITYAFIAQ